MDELIQNTAKKMNEIRAEFIKKNNNIYRIINYNEKGNQKNSLFSPVITRNVYDQADAKINDIKQQCTHLIETHMLNFIRQHKLANKESIINAKHRRFAKNVIALLENKFNENEYPNDKEKQQIANICKITVKQVNNWYTNKRNRAKTYKIINKD